MKKKIDRVSVILAVLLVATLAAFFTGVFPYPFGSLIIAGLLVWRLAGREKG